MRSTVSRDRRLLGPQTKALLSLGPAANLSLKLQAVGRYLSRAGVCEVHRTEQPVKPTLSVLLFSEYATSKLVELGCLIEDLGYWGLGTPMSALPENASSEWQL